MTDNIISSIASGLFGLTGIILKYVTRETDQQIKFVESAINIEEAPKNNYSVRPCYVSTVLDTKEPITLKFSETKWLNVVNKVYHLHSTKTYSKKDFIIVNINFTTFGASNSTRLEHRKTECHTVELEEVHGIKLDNLLPVLVDKLGEEEVLLKHKDESNYNPGFFEKLYNNIPQNVNVSDTSFTIDMKPTYVGDIHKRRGIKCDNSQYLVIGNFNGREFISDDKLIFRKNKNVNEVCDELENKKSTLNFLSNGSFVICGIILTRLFINSRL